MDYPFILLWVFGWCALRTVGFLFQAEQNADARQNQQHTDTAEQQRTETAGDRQRKALAVDDFGNSKFRFCGIAIVAGMGERGFRNRAMLNQIATGVMYVGLLPSSCGGNIQLNLNRLCQRL